MGRNDENVWVASNRRTFSQLDQCTNTLTPSLLVNRYFLRVFFFSFGFAFFRLFCIYENGVCCVACASDNGQYRVHLHIYNGHGLGHGPLQQYATEINRSIFLKCKPKAPAQTRQWKHHFDGQQKTRANERHADKKKNNGKLFENGLLYEFIYWIVSCWEGEQSLAVFTIYHNIITALYSFIIHYGSANGATLCPLEKTRTNLISIFKCFFVFCLVFLFVGSLSWVARRRRLSRRSFGLTFLFFFVIRFGWFFFVSFIVHSNRAPPLRANTELDNGRSLEAPKPIPTCSTSQVYVSIRTPSPSTTILYCIPKMNHVQKFMWNN